MIKGFPSQSKLSQQNYNTVTPLGSDKHGIDVAPKAIFPITGATETPISVEIIKDPISGKLQQHIDFGAATGLREGDVLRFDSGTLISVEAPIILAPSSDVVVIPMILQNITTSTCLFMRYVTLTLNSAGSLVTTAGPLEYLHNAVSTQVEIDTGTPANNKPLPTGIYFELNGVQQQVIEDTGTPANNAPLPVKLTSVTGDINITANDLNVQTSHLGAGFDSMRIGNGTNLMDVNASLEALVHDTDALAELVLIDAKLPATLGSKADAASLAVTQSTEDKVVQAAIQTAVESVNNGLNVVDFLDTPLFDAGATQINGSAGAFVEIVASTAAAVKKLDIIDDIGEYIGIYTGAAAAEVLAAVTKLGGGEIEIQIPIATRLSVRNMKAAAITVGNMAINLLG